MLLAGLGVATPAGPAAAASCKPEPDKTRPAARPKSGCRPAPVFVPYDPDRTRAGRNPGFIDLGNGTEVRVGGRVETDVDVRRR